MVSDMNLIHFYLDAMIKIDQFAWKWDCYSCENNLKIKVKINNLSVNRIFSFFFFKIRNTKNE